MKSKLVWLKEKYNYRLQTHIGGLSSQTHEIGDVFLIEKELHQLHIVEEALRETIEEQAMDEKAREKKIRKKQAADDEFFLEFGVMSRDVLTVGSTMRIPLLYQGEYSQWVERFMNYLEEQTDGEAMINSIKNRDQPLPRVTQVSIARTSSTEQPSLKDKSM
nr:hypothetical protein [Tanacetum cinerariifolium]